MYADKYRVTKRQAAEPVDYVVSINAYHVTIREAATDKVVFRRGGSSTGDDWYDKPHAKICKALEALDKALIDAING